MFLNTHLFNDMVAKVCLVQKYGTFGRAKQDTDLNRITNSNNNNNKNTSNNSKIKFIFHDVRKLTDKRNIHMSVVSSSH